MMMIKILSKLQRGVGASSYINISSNISKSLISCLFRCKPDASLELPCNPIPPSRTPKIAEPINTVLHGVHVRTAVCSGGYFSARVYIRFSVCSLALVVSCPGFVSFWAPLQPAFLSVCYLVLSQVLLNWSYRVRSAPVKIRGTCVGGHKAGQDKPSKEQVGTCALPLPNLCPRDLNTWMITFPFLQNKLERLSVVYPAEVL